MELINATISALQRQIAVLSSQLAQIEAENTVLKTQIAKQDTTEGDEE